LGCLIDVAKNGKEALDLYTDRGYLKYDLIFMDCMMPVMDGYDCSLKIRDFEEENHINRVLICALTANSYQSDKDRCFESGMDYFLAKPVKKEQIYKVLSIVREKKDVS